MTDTNKTPEQMYEDLMLDYEEGYHEYTDIYNPEGYTEMLDGLTEDELEELWNDKFGD